MSNNKLSVPGLRNLGNTCFLNAVLQALASSRAPIEHLLRQASQASEAKQPLAIAVLDCLYSLRYQEISSRRCSVSPKSVLSAVRGYVSADCLVDGQQNDSAEVLEILCSALASEETKLSAHKYMVTQLPWRNLMSIVSSDLGVSNCIAAASQTAHNLVHQDAIVLHKQTSICSDKLNDHVRNGSSSSNSSSSSSSASSSSISEEEVVAGAASLSGRRWPLEGNIVNDMMCITCQHCFVSQHSPFYMLPLALPTSRRCHHMPPMTKLLVAYLPPDTAASFHSPARISSKSNKSLLAGSTPPALYLSAESDHHSGMSLQGTQTKWQTCLAWLKSLLSILQMAQRVHGKFQMHRTVVARNTSLLQCLAALCLPEVINGVHCPRCTLRAAVASWKSTEDVQGLPSSKPTAATAAAAAAPGEAAEVASLSGAAQAAELTAVRTPFAQSEAAPSSTAAAADAAGAPVLSEEEAQLDGGAAKPLDVTAEEASPSTGMQAGEIADASAGDQAATLAAAASQEQDTNGVAAASASIPSASHTAAAAAAAEEGPTGAQLRSRGIIEGLLQSRAPWPDMDFEQLISHAGLKWSPVGSMCVKRIALGQAPRVLCLHLRRAYWTNTGRHNKLSGHVRFSLALSVAPYSAASLPPLSSLSQQYIPDAAQSFWMRSAAATAGGGGGNGGSGGGNGGGSGGCSSGGDNVDVTPPAANNATPIVASERSTERGGSAGQAEATIGAQNAGAPVAELSQSDTQTSASTGDRDAADSSTNTTSGAAPAKAKETARPQRSDPPAHSSPFASAAAAKATDQGNQSTRAGRIGAPGPVKRLLASHALSLASSLTSESSLLDDHALAQDAATDSEHLISSAPSAAAADGSAAIPPHGSLAGRGKSPKGPMQRILASHPLSLASCLSSETSMSASFMLDDTASPSILGDPGQPLTSKAPAPSSSIAHNTKQGSLNKGAIEVSDEATAADTVGSVSRADAGVDTAQADGNKASQASPGVSQGSCSSLQLDTDAQGVGCNMASPCPTEPLTTDNDLTAHHQDASQGQDLCRKQHNLVAAVVHHGGGSSSGHYTVYRCVRLEGQQQNSAHDCWFSISDESVHRVDVRDVLECEATLLIYEQ